MATTSAQPIPARIRYADNVHFQDGAVLTGVLVSLLYLVLAASLDAAGYVESMALLVPITLGALGLGFLMAFSRFDGFFALSHSMFSGLAWILFLMSGLVSEAEIAPFINDGIPQAQAKAYFVLLRWLNWVDAALNNSASADNYIFIFEMAFLVWWLAYLGVWSVFRHGYTWRAIIPTGVVLLINTYYAPRSILGFLVAFCLIAMLVFVRTHLAEQQLRWREQRVYFNQGISLDFLRNGVVYSVIVVALAWLVPGFGRSYQVRTVLAPLNDRWLETQEHWHRLFQGLNHQLHPAAAVFGRTLSLGGERNVGKTAVMSVATRTGRYWRAVVYDAYDGRQWSYTGEDEQQFSAEETIPIAGWEQREVLTQTITLKAPTGGMIFGAPDIVRASVPMQALISPSTGPAPAVEIVLAHARTDLEVGESYTVVSAYAAVTQRALEASGADYPQMIAEKYLQLPDNFSERVARTAQEVTAAGTTAYAKAKLLETFLRTYTYNDKIEAPSPNEDPVEYFLYEIKEGYCDYYATAMAVMLRSLGIPARVASGYAEGTLDEESGLYFVAEDDAHTWVEVYFPGYGWIEFEPTAGETELNRPVGEDPTVPKVLPGELPSQTDAQVPPGGESPYEPQPAGDPIGGATAVVESRLPWAWLALTLAALGISVGLIWRMQVRAPNRLDPDLPSIFFERLQAWAARLGLTLAPSYTPYEQAQRMSQAVLDGQRSIESITEQYVQYRFAGRSSHDAVGQERERAAMPGDLLFGAWQQLRPVLWKAWLRKLFERGPKGEKNLFTLIQGIDGKHGDKGIEYDPGNSHPDG
jgi:hypothetical protein